MVWGPNNKLWVTDRSGIVSIVDPNSGERTTILDVTDSVFNFAEIGLLGLALHPDFVDTPYVYVVGIYLTPNSLEELYDTRITRYLYKDNSLVEPEILHSHIQFGGFHAGGRIIITQDRKLLLARGESTNKLAAQDSSALWGKLLRFNLDGSIPEDNPFPDSPVWAYGFRNPQGLTQDADGTIYTAEHGPDTDDEINIIEKGRNYGWPLVAGYCDKESEQIFCDSLNCAEAYFSTIGNTYGMCAVETYHGTLFPEFDNKIIATSLKSARLHVIPRNITAPARPEEVRILGYTIGRISDICSSPDGRIFLCSRNMDGKANVGYPLPEGDIIVELLPSVSHEKLRLNIPEKTDTILLKLGDSKLYPVNIKNESGFVVPITNWWTVNEVPDEIIPWVFSGNPWLPTTHEYSFLVNLTAKKEPQSTMQLVLYSDSTQETIRQNLVVISAFPVATFTEDTLLTQSIPGTGSMYPVKVVNRGNATLRIQGVRYKGEARGEYTQQLFPIPVICAPGDSVIIDIEFKPTDEYSHREAKLELIIEEPAQVDNLTLIASSKIESVGSEPVAAINMSFDILPPYNTNRKQLRITSDLLGNYRLRCSSVTGEEVLNYIFSHQEREQILELNMEQLPSGTYMILIEGTNARASQSYIHVR